MSNIELLKDQQDTEGLIDTLQDENPLVRVKAAEAIKELNEPDSLEQLADTLLKNIKYGKTGDKIEAIALICGHIDHAFAAFMLNDDNNDRLEAVCQSNRKLQLDSLMNSINEYLPKIKNIYVAWYGIIAEVECGYSNENTLDTLITGSELTKGLDDNVADIFVSQDPFAELREQGYDGYIRTRMAEAVIRVSELEPFFALRDSICRETIRAISRFRGNIKAANALLSVLEGELLEIQPDTRAKRKLISDLEYASLKVSWSSEAIIALGALGDPNTKERLEYLANRDSTEAAIALEFFGNASYDDIWEVFKERTKKAEEEESTSDAKADEDEQQEKKENKKILGINSTLFIVLAVVVACLLCIVINS